jgi:hypothetical protein
MVIQIRNTSDPKDVWCEFERIEQKQQNSEPIGFWVDEDGIRANPFIENILEQLATEIQSEQLWKDAHESV